MRISRPYFIVTLSILLSGCSATVALDSNKAKQANSPQNIIMVVADGMGPAYVTAYRNFADNPDSEGIDRTIFDTMQVGKAST